MALILNVLLMGSCNAMIQILLAKKIAQIGKYIFSVSIIASFFLSCHTIGKCIQYLLIAYGDKCDREHDYLNFERWA